MLRMKITAALLAVLTTTTALCHQSDVDRASYPAWIDAENPQIHALHGHCDAAYTENGVAYSSFVTVDGNGWIVADDTWTKGQDCTIFFDDMGTPDVADDEIVGIVPCHL